MHLLTSLTDTKNETEKYFALTDDLLKTYGEGKWNIKQILVHLSDAEGILLDRIKRIIAEPKQVIWAFKQDLWSNNLEYKTFPLHISKAAFLANRDAIIYLAQKYYDLLGAKEFVHSETGLRTLKEELEKVAEHNQGHIDQIQLAMAN